MLKYCFYLGFTQSGAQIYSLKLLLFASVKTGVSSRLSEVCKVLICEAQRLGEVLHTYVHWSHSSDWETGMPVTPAGPLTRPQQVSQRRRFSRESSLSQLHQ